MDLRHITKDPPQWLLMSMLMILFLLVTLIAYGAALWHGFAPVDDWFLITQNLSVQGLSWENIKNVFTSYDPELYIPLVFLSFQANYLMGGLDPFGFHLVNLILHAGNALLVMGLLRMLTRNRLISVLTGLIFAVHPLHTEAVVWIAGRKDLLSTFFSLLTIIFYLRYREQSRWAYALSILFFLLALLSKAVAITIPAILILIDYCLEERPLTKKFFLDKIPYILLSAIFIIIALAGKQRVIGDSNLLETILVAAKSTVFYLQKMVMPTGLTITYMQNDQITALSPEFLISLLISLGLIVASVWALLKKRWIAFGILFYLITLAPTYLNARKGGTVFFAVDRYAYLPSIGLLFLLAGALTLLSERIQRKIILPAALCMGLVMISLSRSQTNTWATPETLYTHAQEVYPETVLTYVDLAELNRKKGKYAEAFEFLKQGMQYGDSIFLHLSAGRLYANTGDIPAAVGEFEKARTMDPQNPEPLFSLGSLEEQKGDQKTAENYYKQAAVLDESYVAAFVKLGEFAFERGEIDIAQTYFEDALTWNPNADTANLGMGKLLLQKGQTDLAEKHFQKVLALNAYDLDALLALAEIALAQNRKDEARGYAERMLKQDGRHDRAHQILEEIGL